MCKHPGHPDSSEALFQIVLETNGNSLQFSLIQIGNEKTIKTTDLNNPHPNINTDLILA